MCRNLRVDGTFDFESISQRTAGFVGADLAALTKEAAVVAVNRIFKDMFGGDPAHAALLIESKSPAETAATALSNGSVAVPLAGSAASTLEQHPANNKSGEETKAARLTRELGERSRISDQLRAHVNPLNEQQLAPLCITMQVIQALMLMTLY